MKKITIIFALLYTCISSPQAQTTMTIDRLDKLCLSMSDEIRAEISAEKTAVTAICTATVMGKHDFLSYLDNAYYANGRKPRTAIQKQVNGGTLLRLAEGKLNIQEVEDFRKDKYPAPTEMVETEYFFLNNHLVKISLTTGRTDYNAMPRNYWVVVNQLDFVYHDTEPPKKAIYNISSCVHPGNRSLFPTNVRSSDEWIESIMSTAGTTEEQLLLNAIQIYQLYTLNKELFNH